MIKNNEIYTFKFSINENNALNAYIVNNGNLTTYNNIYAEDLLRKLDNEPISDIKTDSNKVIFSNDSCIIIVEDYKKFYECGYTSTFQKHLGRIERFNNKQNVVEAAKMKVKKGFAGTVLVSSMLAAILTNTKENKNNIDNNVTIEQEATTESKFIEPIIESIPTTKSVMDEKIQEEIPQEHITVHELDETQLIDMVNTNQTEENILEIDTSENTVEETINDTQMPVVEDNETNSKIDDMPLTSAYLDAIQEVHNEREIRDSFTYEYNKEPEMVKLENTQKYHDEIEKYASKWGISSNLVYCMMAQESGGVNPNLLQIQFGSWKDMPITQYDFINNRYQTIVLTDNPQQYANKGYTCISRNDLKNPQTNISVGCCLLRNSIDVMDGHVLAGLQCYNYGQGSMKKVLNETSRNTGLSVSDLLADQNDSNFLEYTGVLKNYGDKNYVKNVLTYYLDTDTPITIKFYDKDTDSIEEKDIYIVNKARTL